MAAGQARHDAAPRVSPVVGRYTIARSFELTARSISAFAAGVGDFNPCYLDDRRPGGLVGHPGMVFSFQWNTRFVPDAPFDPALARLNVHAWADVRFARPLRQDDIITSQGQQIAVRQIAPGVLSVSRFWMRDSAGALVAEMDTAGIARGARLDGPDQAIAEPPTWSNPPAPSAAPLWTTAIPIERGAPHVYTECADIWNPIHTERDVALAAGLPDIILHGTASLTIALREIVDRCLAGDPTRVARLAGQLRAMVIPGRPATLRCLARRPASGGGEELFFDLLNDQDAPAIARGLVEARPA